VNEDKKGIYKSYSINGGGSKINLKTANGSISIIKGKIRTTGKNEKSNFYNCIDDGCRDICRCCFANRLYRYNEYVSKNEKSYKKDFDVKPGGKVNIELRCGGTIEIVGWDKNIVAVDLEVSGRNSDELSVEIDQDGNDVNISSYFDNEQHNNKTHQKLFVNVPREI
jgi:hypothetical protein